MAKKDKIPPMPFSTADWLRCPELKVLAPDVRGLWMDMLCYMWESSERGVMIKPNGEIYSKDEIVRLLGVDNSGTGAWLDALIDAQVCAVRDDGAIYSRRMVRDAEISNKRRMAGKRGGDQTKAKIFDKPAPEPEPKKPAKQQTADLFPATENTGSVQEETTPPELTPEQKAKAAKAKKYKYADNVSLTRDEYAKLCESYGEDDVKGIIQVLDNYKGQNGKRYKSDYKAILNWVVNAYNERKFKNRSYGTTISNQSTENTGQTESKRTYRDTL